MSVSKIVGKITNCEIIFSWLLRASQSQKPLPKQVLGSGRPHHPSWLGGGFCAIRGILSSRGGVDRCLAWHWQWQWSL